MKSIRVLITGNCNANCPNCINKSIRGDSMISPRIFRTICEYFSKNHIKNIRIMGGEPTIHPFFSEMMQIAQENFERVTLFTNGLSRHLLDFYPRADDGVNYNFNFGLAIKKESYMLDRLGSRIIEVIIHHHSDTEALLSNLEAVLSWSDRRIAVSLSLDCTENIFIHRLELVSRLGRVFDYCRTKDIEIVLDHALPLCFVYGTSIPVPARGSLCNGDCAGMIDSNLYLHFCNQVSEQSIPIFLDNRLIPFSVLENQISLVHHKTQVSVLEKICRDCPLYGRYCNGGCFVSNPGITRDDIINNTQFPLAGN